MALAHGKVILVGEHAVVYGVPAIAVGVGVAATATARVADTSALTLGGRRIELGAGLAPAEAARETSAPEAVEPPSVPLEARAFGALLASLAGDPAAAHVEAECQLLQPSGVGLGASAAIGVALARAVSAALRPPGAEHSSADLLAAAHAWENVFHGRASGIDAATAFHGGCLWFRSAEPPEPLRLPAALRLAVAIAGPAVSTRKMVESVAALRAAEPRRFELALQSIHALVHEARVALLLGKSLELGAALDRNHRLLCELGVSTPALDDACALARAAGAHGAKLTGGGGGGCVVALVDEHGGQRVLEAWRQQGLECFEATVPAAAPREAAGSAR